MSRKIKDLPKRLTEVNEILKYLPQKEKQKIPKNVFDLINDNMDKKYIFKIDKSRKIYDQDLNRDTIKVISYINFKYLVNHEQHDFLQSIYQNNNKNN